MRPRKRKRRPDWRRKKFVVNQEEILCWVEHYISLTCMHLHRGAICQHNEHLHNGFRDLYAAKRTNGSNSLWQYNSKFTIRPLGYMHLVDAFSWMIHTHQCAPEYVCQPRSICYCFIHSFSVHVGNFYFASELTVRRLLLLLCMFTLANEQRTIGQLHEMYSSKKICVTTMLQSANKLHWAKQFYMMR